MNKYKKALIKFLLSWNNSEWKSQNKIKILVQTNSYFSKDLWLRSFKSKYKYYSNSEFIFPKNKISLIKLIKYADACFLWSLSNFINLEETKLKLIYFGTVGTEFLENKTIPDQIKVFNAKGISSEAIAEYVLTMALILNRDLHLSFIAKKKRKWIQNDLLKNPYIPLKYKKIGILGYGTNGKAIAALLKSLGCYVNVMDVKYIKDECVDSFYLNTELESFLKKSDIIVITPSLNKTTTYLINEAFLEKLKENSILINVSRGKVIRDNDLKKIITSKKIKYVVLDVFEKEPLSFFDWKWKNSKVIVTPHIAGNINYFVNNVMNDFIDKLNQELNL